jgi:hypothetical protein
MVLITAIDPQKRLRNLKSGIASVKTAAQQVRLYLKALYCISDPHSRAYQGPAHHHQGLCDIDYYLDAPCPKSVLTTYNWWKENKSIYVCMTNAAKGIIPWNLEEPPMMGAPVARLE